MPFSLIPARHFISTVILVKVGVVDLQAISVRYWHSSLLMQLKQTYYGRQISK